MTNMYISSCLPFFRFNIPSPTKIVISLCSKLKVCLESTKQHQRLLCRKRKYTVTSMYMCYAVCVEACKYVYIYTHSYICHTYIEHLSQIYQSINLSIPAINPSILSDLIYLKVLSIQSYQSYFIKPSLILSNLTISSHLFSPHAL